MTRLLLTRSTRTTPNQSGRELATLIVRLIVNDEGTARRREERGRAQACDRQTEKAKMSRLLRISSAYLLFLKSLQKRTRNAKCANTCAVVCECVQRACVRNAPPMGAATLRSETSFLPPPPRLLPSPLSRLIHSNDRAAVSDDGWR